MNPQASAIAQVPGDPDAARRISALFSTVEGRAQEIASRLRSIESGVGPHMWAGQAADGFTTLLAATGPDLTTLAASYGRASQALATYATELAAAQDAARAAQAEAATAGEARDRAATDQAAARSDADRHSAEAADAQARLDVAGAQNAEQRRSDALGRETAALAAADQADQALRAAQQKADEAIAQRDAAAARCIRELEDASRAGIETRTLTQQPVAAVGPAPVMTIGTPLDPDPSTAAADAALLAAGVADPKAADEMLDRATARMQEITAHVQAGRPLTEQQLKYINAFAEAAGPGALSAFAVLAPLGAQEGVKRARAAVATSLVASTDPRLRDREALRVPIPAVLKILSEDPFAPLFQQPYTGAPAAVAESVARYEGLSQLLAESAVPMGTAFGVAVGKRALEVSRAATELRDAAPTSAYGREPAVMAAIEKAGRSAAQVMTAVSRNLDSAQELVGDREFRHGLLLTRHLDDSGAVALLDRATAPIAPTEAAAIRSAEIVRDLSVDMAQDPYGWREEIPKGSPISNTIAKIAAEHIDAFSRSDTASDPETRPAEKVGGGWLSRFELSGRDAKDMLTFVAAGRVPGEPDRDLIALHAAAQAYTRDQATRAIEGELDPSTALTKAGNVTSAVNAADFRSAMQVYESDDAAKAAVYDNLSSVAGIPLDRAVEVAAGAAPGWVGDALSLAVDKAMEGFEPEATAGSEGQQTLDDILGRQELDINHLIVSIFDQAGALPADTPNLDAVLDETGHVPSLDSFRDDQVDPDVDANDVGSQDALAEIAARGPAGGDAKKWGDALDDYRDAASLGYVDVDHANPEPRAPLDPALVDKARRSEGHSDSLQLPLPDSMPLVPDARTPVR
jgi:hypothetical protein